MPDRRDGTSLPGQPVTSLKILCYACARRYDIQVVLRAKDGIPPPDGSASILACPRWIERRRDVRCEMRLCDECETPIARAFSSDWLLNLSSLHNNRTEIT